ncbi:receptor-like protein kinase [Seminavis robusta]|uniref:Receptor-like protein kinase n=1 Tax=Seminavis robusta TaxID=568900 RepID=A0A9N8ERB9_9STRA|nr:receptor-like protein kinase [Seminavis robusta]|eukprot:Sro1471_g275430.1 receptor-like protein kinase (2221) ;mRNA; f:8468-15865
MTVFTFEGDALAATTSSNDRHMHMHSKSSNMMNTRTSDSPIDAKNTSNSNKMTAVPIMKSLSGIKFDRVSVNGMLDGSVTLTSEEILFCEEEAAKAGSNANAIHTNVSCTVEITFLENSASLPESGDSVSFRLASLKDLMRFRNAISENIKLLKTQAQKAPFKTSLNQSGTPQVQLQNGGHSLKNARASTSTSSGRTREAPANDGNANNNPFLNHGKTGFQFSAGQMSTDSATGTGTTTTDAAFKRKKRRNPGTGFANNANHMHSMHSMHNMHAAGAPPMPSFGQPFPQAFPQAQTQQSPYSGYPPYPAIPPPPPPSPLTLPYGYPSYPYPAATPPYQYLTPYGHPSYPTFHHHAHIPPPPPTYPPYIHPQQQQAYMHPPHPTHQPPPNQHQQQQAAPTALTSESLEPNHPAYVQPSLMAQSSMASSVGVGSITSVGHQQQQQQQHHHAGHNRYYSNNGNGTNRQPQPTNNSRDRDYNNNDDRFRGGDQNHGGNDEKPTGGNEGPANRRYYEDSNHNGQRRMGDNNMNGRNYGNGNDDAPTHRTKLKDRDYDDDVDVPRQNGYYNDADNRSMMQRNNHSPIAMSGKTMPRSESNGYDDQMMRRTDSVSYDSYNNGNVRTMRRNDSANSHNYTVENTNVHNLMRTSNSTDGSQPSKLLNLENVGISAVRQYVPDVRSSEHSRRSVSPGPTTRKGPQYEPDYSAQSLRGRPDLKRDFRANAYARSLSPGPRNNSAGSLRGKSQRGKDPLADDSVLDDSSSSASSSSSSSSSSSDNRPRCSSEPDLTKMMQGYRSKMHARSSSGNSTSSKQNATFEKKPKGQKAKARPSITKRFREFSNRSLKVDLNDDKYNNETGGKVKRDDTEPNVLAKPQHSSDTSLVSKAQGSSLSPSVTSPAPRALPQRPLRRGLSFSRAQSMRGSFGSNLESIEKQESTKSLNESEASVTAPPTATRKSPTAPASITRPPMRSSFDRMQSLKMVKGKPVLPTGASPRGGNRGGFMRKTSSERFLRTSLLDKQDETDRSQQKSNSSRSLLGDMEYDDSDESNNSDEHDQGAKKEIQPPANEKLHFQSSPPGANVPGVQFVRKLGSDSSNKSHSHTHAHSSSDPRGMRRTLSKSKSYCVRPTVMGKQISLEYEDTGSHSHSHDDICDEACREAPGTTSRTMAMRRRESLSVVEHSAGRANLAQMKIESMRRLEKDGTETRDPRGRIPLTRNVRSSSPMVRGYPEKNGPQSALRKENLPSAKPTNDDYAYDSEEESLEAVRKEFELEARLKKEMASLSNPMLKNGKSDGEDNEDSDCSSASLRTAKKELKLEERLRPAKARQQTLTTRPDSAARSNGNTDQRSVTDRRQLLRTTSSERQLQKPPSLVKKEMARLGSRRNLMAMDSDNFNKEDEQRLSDQKETPRVRATRPGVQYVRSCSAGDADADSTNPSSGRNDRGESADGGAEGKRKGRRRLLRTASSDRDLQKPPSLVRKELARFSSGRNLMIKSEHGEANMKPDPALWRASYEKRKVGLLAARMRNDAEKKPQVNRSQSARNLTNRPSIYKQASFASVRSRREDDEDSFVESANSDVLPDPSKSDQEEPDEYDSCAESRRSDVRQDLVSLGTSSRSLKGQLYPTAADCEDSVTTNTEGSFSKRPSEEKLRPQWRATKPGIQHVKNDNISHSMAKQDMAALGNQRAKSNGMHIAPGAPDRRFRDSANYDEESKEEITEDPEAVMPGISFARNNDKDMVSDQIGLKELQLSGGPTDASVAVSTMSNDFDAAASNDVDAAAREKSKLAGDIDHGNGMIDYDTEEFNPDGLIMATLVDEDVDNIVTAVTVDPEEEFRRKRKVYIMVSIGCGCLLLIITLIAVFAGPSSSNMPDVPPPLTPEERYELYYNHLLGLGYNSTVLDDPSSPQSRALTWISMVDTLYEDPSNLKPFEMIEKVNQRFYLVVFYYTMLQEGQWNNCKEPETGESNACVHHNTESFGVEGQYYNQQQSQPTFRWLSNVDECGWGGIQCDDGEWASHMWLGGNSLEGTLPIELAELRSLKVLDLQQNRLKGRLPPTWGLMAVNGSSLESIRLDKNALTGTIPKEWAMMNSTSLRELILAHNFFTGSLPSELGLLQGMEDFSVMYNSLTGTLPETFGEMSKLQTIHFAKNSFEGRMPASVCDLVEEDLFEASTDCLDILSDSYVQCSCCTTCCSHTEAGDGVCELKFDIKMGIQRGIGGGWFQSDEGEP